MGLAFLVTTLPVYQVYPSSHDDAPSGVRFRLPLAGPVTVAWGGGPRSANYHVSLPDQRWAYDLLVTRQGQSFSGGGNRLEDYYCYDAPVLAPGWRTRPRHSG